ncbi:hypothetical protein VTN96DRAFT_6587 [Rasamsonia emersonii]
METLSATWKYVMEFKTHGWIPLREDEDFDAKDFDPNFFERPTVPFLQGVEVDTIHALYYVVPYNIDRILPKVLAAELRIGDEKKKCFVTWEQMKRMKNGQDHLTGLENRIKTLDQKAKLQGGIVALISSAVGVGVFVAGMAIKARLLNF